MVSIALNVLKLSCNDKRDLTSMLLRHGTRDKMKQYDLTVLDLSTFSRLVVIITQDYFGSLSIITQDYIGSLSTGSGLNLHDLSPFTGVVNSNYKQYVCDLNGTTYRLVH